MIRDKIVEMIMSARKDGDILRSETYKLIKAEFVNYTTAENAKPLDEKTEISILKKMVKERQTSALLYQENNRYDLAEKEKKEADIIKELLPEEVSPETILEYLTKTYTSGIQKNQLGLAIKEVKNKFPGADGKTVAELVKSLLK